MLTLWYNTNMYYRRNSDETIRELEREYNATGSPHALDLLNAARERSGIPIRKILPPLDYGWNSVLPATATAAWGARMILSERGGLVHNRQSAVYANEADRKELTERLNNGGLAKAREEIGRLIDMGRLNSRTREDIVFFEDQELMIIGNTNGSSYIYVTAFLKPSHWERAAFVFKSCEGCGAERLDDLLSTCSHCYSKICQDCGVKCQHCDAIKCSKHLVSDYTPKCQECGSIICSSPDCERNRPSKDCPDCGRLFCYDCRDDVECPCADENWCDECGEKVEECEECDSEYCVCDPCECDTEEDY